MRRKGTDLRSGYQRSRASEEKVFEVTKCQMAFLGPKPGQRFRHPFFERCQLRDRGRMCLWLLQFVLTCSLLLSNEEALLARSSPVRRDNRSPAISPLK